MASRGPDYHNRSNNDNSALAYTSVFDDPTIVLKTRNEKRKFSIPLLVKHSQWFAKIIGERSDLISINIDEDPALFQNFLIFIINGRIPLLEPKEIIILDGPTGLSVKFITELKEILEEVAETTHGEFFAKPVAVLWPECAEFYKAQITQEVCLEHIWNRLDKNTYDSVKEIEADVDLLVSNAIEFNGPDHEIIDLAEQVRTDILHTMPEVEDVIEREFRPRAANYVGQVVDLAILAERYGFFPIARKCTSELACTEFMANDFLSREHIAKIYTLNPQDSLLRTYAVRTCCYILLRRKDDERKDGGVRNGDLRGLRAHFSDLDEDMFALFGESADRRVADPRKNEVYGDGFEPHENQKETQTPGQIPQAPARPAVFSTTKMAKIPTKPKPKEKPKNPAKPLPRKKVTTPAIPPSKPQAAVTIRAAPQHIPIPTKAARPRPQTGGKRLTKSIPQKRTRSHDPPSGDHDSDFEDVASPPSSRLRPRARAKRLGR